MTTIENLLRASVLAAVLLALVVGTAQVSEQASFKNRPMPAPEDGGQFVKQGSDPVVRYPVAHQHGADICTGYLFFSTDSIRYEALSPEKHKKHSFQYSRADLSKATQLKFWGAGGYPLAEFSFRDGHRFRFYQVHRKLVESGNVWRVGYVNWDDVLDFQDLLKAAKSFDQLVSELQTRASRPPVGAGFGSASATVLAPTPSILTIKTHPGNVQVYLDDEFKGNTSAEEGRLLISALPPGNHRLRLTAAGYKEWRHEITMSPGDTPTVDAVLEAAGPKPLTADEVEELFRNGVPKSRIMTLVSQYGVDFQLTAELEEKLRKMGADSDTVRTIVTTKK